jgi:hypothetical protein
MLEESGCGTGAELTVGGVLGAARRAARPAMAGAGTDSIGLTTSGRKMNVVAGASTASPGRVGLGSTANSRKNTT